MRPGRPRAFDIDNAVSAALHLFMIKGYEGATLNDLTEAMQIEPPSLYAAFGSKEGLFRKALDMYAARRMPVFEQALSEPSSLDVMRRLLRAHVDGYCDPSFPPGCLFVQGALTCSDSAAAIRTELAERRAEIIPMLSARFERAVSEGDLPPTTNALALARYVGSILDGMAVQASGGAGFEQLNDIVKVVLQRWPSAATSTNTADTGSRVQR